MPMENELISHILFMILEESKSAVPQPEPKEVWKDREWRKPKPVGMRNDIF